MIKIARKKVVLIAILICVGLLAIVLLVLFSRKSERSPQNISEIANAKNTIFSLQGIDEKKISSITDPRAKEWLLQLLDDPKFMGKIPIEFYGKVVDNTDGKPIADATIDFQWSDTSPRGMGEKRTFSDMEGKFNLSGVKGGHLTVYPSKEGYSPVSKGLQKRFEYAAFFDKDYYKPDPQNPMIFKLHKAGSAEKLLVKNKIVKLTPNGTATPILLRTASVGTPADIEIATKHSEQQPHNKNSYDWSVTITGANGAGLIECDDEFMFEAPLEGYISQYQYEFKASETTWKNEIEKKYYIRSGDGKIYARIDVLFSSSAVWIHFYINPSGSRILESSQAVSNNYVMMQAAVAGNCYSANVPTYSYFTDEEITKPTPLNANDFGYGNYLASAIPNAGRVLNCYNPDDGALSATTGGGNLNWKLNQKWKPDDLGVEAKFYNYTPTTATSGTGALKKSIVEHLGLPDIEHLRNVTDAHESMAFISRARAEAIGADNGSNGQPIIPNSIDLSAKPYSFSNAFDDHSGQFLKPVQEVSKLYDEILKHIRGM